MLRSDFAKDLYSAVVTLILSLSLTEKINETPLWPLRLAVQYFIDVMGFYVMDDRSFVVFGM